MDIGRALKKRRGYAFLAGRASEDSVKGRGMDESLRCCRENVGLAWHQVRQECRGRDKKDMARSELVLERFVEPEST